MTTPAVLLCAALAAAGPGTLPSRSEPAARELASLMAAQKLDTIAVRDPQAPDTFVAAMLFPDVQLLVVSGRPIAPAAAQALLDQKKYAELYSMLQTAVVPDGKFFVQDLKADGLHARAPDTADIVYERVVNQTIFDGDPGKRHLSEAKYEEQFTAADARYAKMLELLSGAIKGRPTSQ